MTSELDPIDHRSAPRAGGRRASRHPRWSRRRGIAGVLASLSVVAFAGAIIAPAGMALADPVPTTDADTSFSLAAAEPQDLTVTVDGSTFEPLERGEFSVYVTPKPTPKPKPKTASTGGGAPLRYSGGGSPAEWMAAAGIDESNWGYVDYIVSRESGWNPNATNKSSGACGLVQALPCSKVPGNGYDPVDNLRWANGYAVSRYGSWQKAYNFWSSRHWW